MAEVRRLFEEFGCGTYAEEFPISGFDEMDVLKGMQKEDMDALGLIPADDLKISAVRGTGGGASASDDGLAGRDKCGQICVTWGGLHSVKQRPKPETIGTMQQKPVDMQAQVRALWDGFLSSSEVDVVESSFTTLLQSVNLDAQRGSGLGLFRQLVSSLTPHLNFRQCKLLKDLEKLLNKKRAVLEALRGSKPEESNTTHGDILICGAGPVGLRAACEAAILGFKVTVVEKRETFSRANILCLWERTWNDVLSLGAKIYFPNIPVNPRPGSGVSFHMGTRELQLTFLKTSALLGVEVIYGHELFGLIPPQSAQSRWCGRVLPFVKIQPGPEEAETDGLKHAGDQDEAARAALEGLKSHNKCEDYIKTHKCNAMEYAGVDDAYINGSALQELKSERSVPFDHYIIAEGEWSNTTKKLGFDKMVDKFAQALGLVINLSFDKNDPSQNKLESFGGANAAVSEIIQYETMEYLKGETHYIVVAIKKKSLLDYGALREDRASSRELLQASNLDIGCLRQLGRDIASACGLPPTTEFYPHNPVQLFDYSSRARCLEAVKLLRGGAGMGSLVRATKANIRAAEESGRPALVMPVGDALLEPFWPQGLGTNRGFHTALNAVWACVVARECCCADAAAELRFAYRMIVMTGFHPGDLQMFAQWNTDPMNRFAKELMGTARAKIRKSGTVEDDMPDRIAKLPATICG